MNPLIDDGSTPRALLALEDGSVFEGLSCGAAGETFGEVVFNTSMVGYQEIVSDPSYAGQIVTLTYPQVGNYGVCEEVMQSPELYLRGLVVRDMCRTPNNWTSTGSLPELLGNHGVVAIEGVDTRALTLTIRDKGAMRAAISTVDLDPESLVARVRASERISEHNFVPDVSRKEIVTLPAQGERRFRVVAFDCGVKQGILDGLTSRGCEVTVVPWDTPAEKVLEMDPDGVFFSNGPGDPEQVGPTAAAARAIIGKKPVFGICLGNQLISIAAGSEIEKLPYGHHGGNEPVMNLLTGKVEITAQNHNYGLVFKTMGELVPELSGGVTEHFDDMREWSRRGIAPVVMTKELGRVRLTHVNLNDGTPEGIKILDAPTFSVQYHPEACPGPHDSAYLFEAFCRLMEGKEDYLAIDVREGRRF
ncbi:glutamine-hydrolyzing carbamoyl-phosphate synthase small subunit [Parafannyhessea umbonata]|uniref:glutamine-hydrolyzing carbamoyl-phosphate synthase small subunit n=1 Tax=Parafannyhessea umbonata TaxID=604330 RepID=UPI002A820B64|nr:glutamine-hydrolyzing carbamoyl-phosphate synthase small subunit [Parafannyhessea umbonata]MDY4015593.1 glutamine-hydrolyzing carbamoyl-phosphate synthase small subunit [Parafannyhessea umbonata]